MKFVKLIKAKRMKDYEKDPHMPYYTDVMLYDDNDDEYYGGINFGLITEDNYYDLDYKENKIGKYFVYAFDARTDEKLADKIFNTEDEALNFVEQLKKKYANV